MDEEYEPRYELVEFDRDILAGRGQFTMYALLMDEVLDGLVAYDTSPDDEAVLPHQANNMSFYALFMGMVAASQDYRDALVGLAGFGVDSAISAQIYGMGLPDKEDEILWPADLSLPKRAEGGFSIAPALQRDHARDAAIHIGLHDGSNVAKPNVARLEQLTALMLTAAEMGPESIVQDCLQVAAVALWNAGEVEAGLDILEALAETQEVPNDGFLMSKFLFTNYSTKHPDGPEWIRIAEWRAQNT